MTWKRLCHIAWLVGLMVLVGCSRSDTVEVSGLVTWNGEAMPQGDIVFVAADPHIAAAAGKIVDGSYKFRCKPGEKRVEVTSYHLTGKKNADGKPIGEMYVPERYSSQSTLRADVTYDGSNKFDFSLKP